MKSINKNGMRKRAGKRSGRIILIAFIASEAFLCILLTAASCLILKGNISLKMSSLIGKASFTMAAFLGCYVASRRSDRRKLLYAGAVAACLLALTSIVSISMHGMKDMNLWVPAGICAGMIPLTAMLSLRSKGHGYR